MEHSIALVTGTTSGVGYEAARLLATSGYRQVFVTGRSLALVQATVTQLAAQTEKQVFTPLQLELNEPTSVQSALAELEKRGHPIDFILLNAGMVPGKQRVITAAGVEASQAPLIGHHQLTVGLLRANLLSPNARIVIASAEPARGGVPIFKYTDVEALAAKYYQGDLTAAMESLLRNGPNVKYVPNNAYADAKLIVAWWAAALARRLPSGMAVFAVSPGAATATNVGRNAGWAVKYLMIPIVNLIPGMNQTPETAARRYLQASEFGTDVSGQFFASAKGKFTGPIEAQRQPHLLDGANQEAAWQAVANVSGVNWSYAESLRAVS
ncbi:SDR family NAD(P)-dependent oxidoreductase [Paraburkholderia terrae]|uniref:SDR family NAD(P)-dependent oxidoreductase n=1 Tax=Paraburkholderia terrae TaxID=311230 RepID=UPI00296AAE65|nr:SDR family NAD(P)-dependent oxidoreductase [Paraburkholderia terrae]MDW3660585.1 SDR family NAD(P)-dependent oxidoreductase [Paraburkholderia terrae]